MPLRPGEQVLERAGAGRQQLAEDRPVRVPVRHRGTRHREHLAPLRRLPQVAVAERVPGGGRHRHPHAGPVLPQHRTPRPDQGQEDLRPGRAVPQQALPQAVQHHPQRLRERVRYIAEGSRRRMFGKLGFKMFWLG